MHAPKLIKNVARG